jgi:hypothetical protein
MTKEEKKRERKRCEITIVARQAEEIGEGIKFFLAVV